MFAEVITPVVNRYMAHVNYRSIGLLMTIESSFIPFPSEVIIPPAGWKAAQGLLNSWWVLLAATIGALIWALFNYYIALWLGRKVIYRLANTRRAHMLLIDKESIEKAEIYFRSHGKTSTFIGRLLPAIRQLISLPAGLAKMDIKYFILYTTLGALLWNIILFITGYILGQHREKVKEYNHVFTNIVYGIIIGGIVFITIRYILKKKKKSN